MPSPFQLHLELCKKRKQHIIIIIYSALAHIGPLHCCCGIMVVEFAVLFSFLFLKCLK